MKRTAAVLIALTLAANAYALSGATSPKPSNPPHPVVNINTATEAQYAMLPGVGPKLASALNDYVEACCDHREGKGAAFKSANDLLKVKGIKAAKLAKMLPYIVLKGATTATVKIAVAKVNGLTFKAPAAAPKPVGKSRCAQPGARCAG